MNIAIIGHGKMGKAIEKLAKERGHVTRILSRNSELSFLDVDVAIDFSTPDSAFKNIQSALKSKTPIVSGTTGWLDKFEEAKSLCQKHQTAFLYASNFSIGMNLFFELNKKLDQLMVNQKYQASLLEIHHTQKVDIPSGTAITLTEDLHQDIEIKSQRTGEVPGTHIISYKSDIDSIQIKHEAHNRLGFAMGAIIAAEWIFGKKGFFEMKDVLKF